ncbi:hypothetical protein [Streptomyces sioyaensis]|uniref:hypothetical protein n=1 Tax=Streptomyces sioyaensis TaxID=67364 RepID=UPI00379C6991
MRGRADGLGARQKAHGRAAAGAGAGPSSGGGSSARAERGHRTLRGVTGQTLRETPEGNGFPADSLRAELRDNGFALADPDQGTGGWTPTGDQDRYTTACYQTDETTA